MGFALLTQQNIVTRDLVRPPLEVYRSAFSYVLITWQLQSHWGLARKILFTRAHPFNLYQPTRASFPLLVKPAMVG